MNGTELLSFLLPNFNDPVQLVFFLLIFGLVSIAVIWAKVKARPDIWELNWNNRTDDLSDDLDSEHGSIHDLSEAVASKPEKLMELLPGILLVIGLLGTFIGLGISLNKAAAALSGSGNIGELDSSMQNLMAMLQGLGIKFKASTWGISGFLVMKIISAFMGLEHKRLRWCISKVKIQIDERRKIEADTLKKNSSSLISAIKGMSTNLCNTFESHMISNTNSLIQSLNSVTNKLNEINEGIIDNKKGLVEVRNVIALSIKENKDNISVMKESVVGMGKSAEKLSSASGELEIIVGKLDVGISNSLDKIKNDLGDGIKDMSNNIGKATADIGIAVSTFSQSIGETMDGVKTLMVDSDKRQTQAQAAIVSATGTLGESASVMQENLGKIGTEINSGLKAISTGNQKVEFMMSGFQQMVTSLEKVADSLTKFNPFAKKEKPKNNYPVPK